MRRYATFLLALFALACSGEGFGSSMLNDKKLLDDFWALVEHLLNTVLFALGGAVRVYSVIRGIFCSQTLLNDCRCGAL